MNSCILLILDSCRFDTLERAWDRMPNLRRVGHLERRFSYATWTLPSHLNLCGGLLPHRGEKRLAASVYADEWDDWRERLDLPDGALAGIAPEYSLPRVLHRLGYWTGALVSMPCLAPGSPVHRLGWRTYERIADRDGLWTLNRHLRDALIDLAPREPGKPWFWLLNTGETHYPYGLADLPVLHGAGGAARDGGAPAFDLSSSAMAALHAAQVEAAVAVDAAIGDLLASVPPGTRLIVTSDHGELFGEDGCFGHGPYAHPKLLEVPYVEGVVP